MTVMRYTLLRIMVFFGTLCLLYLVHLRGFWLIAVSLLGSMLISFFLLRRPREELSRTIAAKVASSGREYTGSSRCARRCRSHSCPCCNCGRSS